LYHFIIKKDNLLVNILTILFQKESWLGAWKFSIRAHALQDWRRSCRYIRGEVLLLAVTSDSCCVVLNLDHLLGRRQHRWNAGTVIYWSSIITSICSDV